MTGSPDFVLTTTEGEVEMGKEAAQQVEQQMGFIQDPALAAYVEAVGQRLSQHSPRQDVKHEFHVVEMPEPNAFALPGGFVYVSRGLLVLTNSEDELAGVIGRDLQLSHPLLEAGQIVPLDVVLPLLQFIAQECR